MNKLNAAIIGARGYTGLELAKLLNLHPEVKKIYLFSSNKDWHINHDRPEISKEKVEHLHPNELESKHADFDIIFLALGASQATKYLQKLEGKGHKIIDLSGAHRLPQELAQKFYGEGNFQAENLDEKNYGMIPFQKDIGQFVSNPGCYVTASLMGIIPLLQHDQIQTEGIIFDAKSGTTGAGRKPSDLVHFSELHGQVRPYNIGKHRHHPEINHYAEYFSGKKIQSTFTTTLVPIKRGILSTIYAQIKDGVTLESILTSFKNAYSDYPQVEVYPVSAENDFALNLSRVVENNRTIINFHLHHKQLTVFSMIDNLVKGASGQAIENMNRMFNFPVTTGLLGV